MERSLVSFSYLDRGGSVQHQPQQDHCRRELQPPAGDPGAPQRKRPSPGFPVWNGESPCSFVLWGLWCQSCLAAPPAAHCGSPRALTCSCTGQRLSQGQRALAAVKIRVRCQNSQLCLSEEGGVCFRERKAAFFCGCFGPSPPPPHSVFAKERLGRSFMQQM